LTREYEAGLDRALFECVEKADENPKGILAGFGFKRSTICISDLVVRTIPISSRGRNVFSDVDRDPIAISSDWGFPGSRNPGSIPENP
jgi:hypothetical protein